MLDAKKDKQITFRLDSLLYARFQAAADHNKLTRADFARRLVEWSLKHCEERGSVFALQGTTVQPPMLLKARHAKHPAE